METVQKVVEVLLPSFILTKIFSTAESLVPQNRRTSYLDGLKGIASWIVFNTHLSPLLSRRMGAGWGHDDNSRTFLQLPFVHWIHAGGYPIHIFFVINGAILSFSTVKAMDASPQDPAAMMKRLSLAVFRRPFRLFMPAFACTFLIFFLVRLNAFQAIDDFKDDTLYFGWPLSRMWPERMPSLWSQLYDLFQCNIRMLRVLERNEGRDYSNPYNTPMWTSAVQYQGTLLINLAHAACFYISRRARKLSLLGMITISIFAGQFLFLAFLLGWLVAELDMTSTAPRSIPKDVESQSEKPSPARRILPQVYASLALVLGLYLASYPRYEPERTDGFQYLYNITPPSLGVSSDLWHAIAAFLTVLAVGNLPVLQAWLSCTHLRCIGRLSFAIYLTHLAATHLPGVFIFDRIWSLTGRDTKGGEAAGFILAYIVTWFVNIWVADIWARTVEKWCTTLAEKFQKVMLTKLPK